MRITERKLRRIIRSAILENESIRLNESILDTVKAGLKKAMKNISDFSKNDYEQHMKHYPEYIEARTGVIKKWKAKKLCEEYFEFAKKNEFDKGTQGKYSVVEWLREKIDNESSSKNNYEDLLKRLYLEIFEELLEKELINTKVLGPISGTENWRWNNKILYSREGKEKAKFKN